MAILKALTSKQLTDTTNVLENWAADLVERYNDKLERARCSGELIDSISFDVKIKDSNFEVSLNLLDYWYYIENGRQPGTFPPVDAMINFVRQKPIIPTPYTLPSGRQVIPTENQLAFLIGRKIKEEGIEGKQYLESSIQEISQLLVEDLAKAFGSDLNRHVNLIFNQ